MRKKILAPSLVFVMNRWAEQPHATRLKELKDDLNEIADIDVIRPVDSQKWAEKIKNVNILAGRTVINEEFLKSADNLEMIQAFGIGYESIDIPACTKKDIIVCNVAEIYSESVAQHTWALILDLTKHITRSDRAIRAGTWQSEDWMGFQIWGKTLGVIGLGNNGARIAIKGRLAFGMNILAYDPYVLPARAQLFGVELVSLERLLKESDIVSINVPLTHETYQMIGEEQLSIMKESAFLVNTCRGKVIDETALVECLLKGGIQGAGLDVFEFDSLDQGSPLMRMENVILTPHIASSTTKAVEKTYQGAVDNIIRYLKGIRPNWIINPEAYKV